MARKGMNQVSVYNPNKVLSASEIGCGGEFDITLSLCAEPNITENPVDIALVLDRSGSMSGSPLVNLKKGASSFIDIIEEATDGKKDGEIGNGSTMGIVRPTGKRTAKSATEAQWELSAFQTPRRRILSL